MELAFNECIRLGIVAFNCLVSSNWYLISYSIIPGLNKSKRSNIKCDRFQITLTNNSPLGSVQGIGMYNLVETLTTDFK